MESFKTITNISHNSWDGNDQHKNDAVDNMRRMVMFDPGIPKDTTSWNLNEETKNRSLSNSS